jgi:hypothetical protein
MFFKRKKGSGERLATLSGIAWDDKTISAIAERTHLYVEVTSITRKVSMGETSQGQSDPTCVTFASGIIAYPKFIAVHIGFEPDARRFGDTRRFGVFYAYVSCMTRGNPARTARRGSPDERITQLPTDGALVARRQPSCRPFLATDRYRSSFLSFANRRNRPIC